MNNKIIISCTGKLKEEYYKKGVAHYLNSITNKIDIEIYETTDEKIPENPSLQDMKKVVDTEGRRMMQRLDLKKRYFYIALDQNGEKASDAKIKQIICRAFEAGCIVVFMIGGSLGLSSEIKNKANYGFSFSDMTMPHQMARLVILERLSVYFGN